jgi:hypothetical protein
MSIRFNCECGRTLQVADEHAGKKARCKGCGATPTVPAPEPEDDDEVEMDVEVVEDEPAKEEKIAKEKRPKLSRPEDEDDRRPLKRKKRSRRGREDREGPMAQMYMNQAKKDLERDEMRTRSYGRDDEEKGWTIGNVHITAGVIGGASMLFLGILCMILIAIFKDDEDVIIGPRIFIGAIACTLVGIVTLVKSLFFGEED